MLHIYTEARVGEYYYYDLTCHNVLALLNFQWGWPAMAYMHNHVIHNCFCECDRSDQSSICHACNYRYRLALLTKYSQVVYYPLPLQLALYPFLYLFLRSPSQGAQTTIYCTVSDEIGGVSGRHFRDCRESHVSLPAPLCSSAQRLWDISVSMTGLTLK